MVHKTVLPLEVNEVSDAGGRDAGGKMKIVVVLGHLAEEEEVPEVLVVGGDELALGGAGGSVLAVEVDVREARHDGVPAGIPGEGGMGGGKLGGAGKAEEADGVEVGGDVDVAGEKRHGAALYLMSCE